VEPMIREKHGRKLGNSVAAGALCDPPMSGDTLRWYSSQTARAQAAGRRVLNPCPQPVERDTATSQKLWWLDEIEAWDKGRPGRGNWQGLGAKYRREIIGEAQCPTPSTTTPSTAGTSSGAGAARRGRPGRPASSRR
jgi:hypothetical protein